MTTTVVEYTRFVEVQQRRARVRATLTAPPSPRIRPATDLPSSMDSVCVEPTASDAIPGDERTTGSGEKT